jgi:hypothetical protein
LQNAVGAPHMPGRPTTSCLALVCLALLHAVCLGNDLGWHWQHDLCMHICAAHCVVAASVWKHVLCRRVPVPQSVTCLLHQHSRWLDASSSLDGLLGACGWSSSCQCGSVNVTRGGSGVSLSSSCTVVMCPYPTHGARDGHCPCLQPMQARRPIHPKRANGVTCNLHALHVPVMHVVV